jgi:hypothetical protein
MALLTQTAIEKAPMGIKRGILGDERPGTFVKSALVTVEQGAKLSVASATARGSQFLQMAQWRSHDAR